MVGIFLLFVGLLLLVVGAEFLVRSSVALSFKFKLSKLVIGMTVVSFATSAPELLVSLQAALEGSSDIALGNVIGSNIANIGMVLGLTAIITPLTYSSDIYKNWIVMMFFSVIVWLFLFTGEELKKWEGLVLLVLLIIFLYWLIRRARKEHIPLDLDIDDALQNTSNFKIIAWLLIGSAALYFGSEWLVDGAKEMAIYIEEGGERVISVTIVAIGTSVPELAASVIAALKKEKAISLGNLIGSNIFNIASVLGLTAIIQPIKVNSDKILSVDIIWMFSYALILLPMVYISSHIGTKNQFGRKSGLFLFGGYWVFIILTFL